MEQLELDSFIDKFHPIHGDSHIFGGHLIERTSAPLMKVTSAAADKKICSVTLEKGNFVCKSGLNFNSKGFFITEEPVPDGIKFLL